MGGWGLTHSFLKLARIFGSRRERFGLQDRLKPEILLH
jgi:hypothetical protein